jgi:hypothetical protein
MTQAAAQRDLFNGPCGDCRHLDARALASGVCYCRRFAVWRWPRLTVDCGAYKPGERR